MNSDDYRFNIGDHVIVTINNLSWNFQHICKITNKIIQSDFVDYQLQKLGTIYDKSEGEKHKSLIYFVSNEDAPINDRFKKVNIDDYIMYLI